MFSWLRAPLAALFLGISTVLSHAYPTLYGDTGLVQAPTAEVMSLTGFQIGARQLGNDSLSGTPISVTAGLANDAELFMVFSSLKGRTGNLSINGGGAKKVLLNEDLYGPQYPGLAVGFRLLNVSPAKENRLEAYVAASKTIIHNSFWPMGESDLRLHGGMAYTRYSYQNQFEQFTTPFIGFSFTGINNDSFVVDYLPGHSKKFKHREAVFSAALRLKLGEDLSLEMGNTNPYGLGEANGLYGGLLYGFGE